MQLNVSVIIPAYNAADTLSETLDSLCSQIFSNWEAIVVDDGSSDDTAVVAAGYAEQSSRIRVVRQAHSGVSAARNTGISLARFDWLLFLDAHDLIAPQHLERLTGTLASDSVLDAVYCGWARFAPGGELSREHCWSQSGDMFAVFARLAAFPIHACLVRRALVEAVGAFDISFQTCEDWDLWQRIARTGACFCAIPDVLAFDRMRPVSASTDTRQILIDGLRVIEQGHAPDHRVPSQMAFHADGLPADEIPALQFHYLCWTAALALGSGTDARLLLDLLHITVAVNLDPNVVADRLYRALILPSRCLPADWVDLWPDVEDNIDAFLSALEEKSATPGLARRARIMLERLIIEHAPEDRALQIGSAYAVQIEVTEPVADIAMPPHIERFYCRLQIEGEALGLVVLPACEGVVPGLLIADAITSQFAWPILGRFFNRTCYPQLRVEEDGAGVSLWRGSRCLARDLPTAAAHHRLQAHDQLGWEVFLQEIWGVPDLSSEKAYDPDADAGTTVLRVATDNRIELEVSDALPDVALTGTTLYVTLTIGGVAVGVVPVVATESLVRAAALRASITTEGGMELCRAAVREGLIGQPLAAEPATLRARLVVAAERQSFDQSGVPRALVSANGPTRVHANRTHQPIGTSASRLAVLPAACAGGIAVSSAMAKEPSFNIGGSVRPLARVLYAPSAIVEPIRATSLTELTRRANATMPEPAALYNRDHFEMLFARTTDPWKYTSPYEQTKYEQTLSLLPAGRIEKALEIASAEGHFTVQLAPRVGTLLATDISQVALQRIAERCTRLKNVRTALLDLTHDPLPGQFDLIVCSEVLYFVGDRAALWAVAQKIAAGLKPQGYLLMAHAHQLVDDPNTAGFDWGLSFGAKVIGETFARIKDLRLVKELRTPAYRIQLFQRQHFGLFRWYRPAPKVISIPQSAALPPDTAPQFFPNGGQPNTSSVPAKLVTERLPILMYHRIAPIGSSTLRRHRVTPSAFEEQLRYLRDGGYYSISLEEWYVAVAAKTGLPGRAVLLTFDDGYRDFATHAWPLLQKYGFSATVFLVAGAVGGTDTWNRAFSEPVALLDWDEIRALHAAGVAFGAHSFSHTPLTALSPTEVVSEAVQARALLAQHLDAPPPAFAYPFGDTDPAVQHLIGACGYLFGLSCRPGRCRFYHSLLDMPRIEVMGTGSLQEFIVQLGG